MFPALTIVINVPALDRLVSFLEGAQQAQIDVQVAQIKALTARLAATNDKLKAQTERN